MRKNAKVYIVTSGTYSDYRIVACFKTREGAEACMKTDDDSRIEEYTFYDTAREPRPYSCVQVDDDGNEVRRWLSVSLPWEIEDDTCAWFNSMRDGVPTFGARGVSPRSYTVALKAARDALMQAKAEYEATHRI